MSELPEKLFGMPRVLYRGGAGRYYNYELGFDVVFTRERPPGPPKRNVFLDTYTLKLSVARWFPGPHEEEVKGVRPHEFEHRVRILVDHLRDRMHESFDTYESRLNRITDMCNPPPTVVD